MAQATAKTSRKARAAETAAAPRRHRGLFLAAALLFVAWAAVSHFVVRPALRRTLEETFAAEAHVPWAVLWPNLDASAFGVTLEGDHFRCEASRVGVGLRVWGLFGGRLVSDLTVAGLRAEMDEGEPVHLFRDPVAEGEPAPAGADLDPLRLPPIRFERPAVDLRGEDGVARRLFATGAVAVEQVAERSFDISCGAGDLAGIPFERLTARLVPRAGHLLVHDLKLQAFHGMLGGFLDVHSGSAGSFNGEVEWHFVEAERVWRTYGLPYAEKRRGDFSGRMVFRGARPALAALEGTGTLEMRRAVFFSPLSFRVFLTLKIPVAAEAPLTSADVRFSFEKSLVYLESAAARARDFELEGQGICSFAGAVDMEISHAGTTVAVSGDLEDPRIKVLPMSGITAPFDRIFRERVGK